MRAQLLTLVCLAGCGSERASMDNGLDPLVEWRSESMSPPPRPETPTLSRRAVQEVVAKGPGAFLQRIELSDYPVYRHGKFHGFRISSLRQDPAFWRGVDLRPGDIILRVNGFSVGRPEDAFRAMRSLEVASELFVEYERAGVPRELRYAISEDEEKAVSSHGDPPAPPAR